MLSSSPAPAACRFCFYLGVRCHQRGERRGQAFSYPFAFNRISWQLPSASKRTARLTAGRRIPLSACAVPRTPGDRLPPCLPTPAGRPPGVSSSTCGIRSPGVLGPATAAPCAAHAGAARPGSAMSVRAGWRRGTRSRARQSALTLSRIPPQASLRATAVLKPPRDAGLGGAWRGALETAGAVGVLRQRLWPEQVLRAPAEKAPQRVRPARARCALRGRR